MFISTGLTAPYYATIFSSLRDDNASYDAMAERIEEMVKQQQGFLGMETVRDPNGSGITVCYWKTMEDIKRWKEVELHKQAQQIGKNEWYKEYAVRVAEIKESYERIIE